MAQVPQWYVNMSRASQGEAGMAFFGYPYEDGWALLDGPGGAAGHAWNAPGFDGVAFRLEGEFAMHVLDNKALMRPGNVSSATALVENLLQNLGDLMVEFAKPQYNDVPRIREIRSAISATRVAVSTGRALPDEVRLVVTNYGGASTGVTQALREAGVEFRNLDIGAAVGSRGAPPMEPPLPGRGENAAAIAEARIAGLTLLLMGAEFVVRGIHDRVQAKRIQEKIRSRQAEIEQHLGETPTDGVLIVLYFVQTEAALRDPFQSQIPPDFRFLEIFYGETQQEAMRNYATAPAPLEGPPPHMEFATQEIWIPPRVFREPNSIAPRERGTSPSERGTTPR